jgi:hypothetical protein
MVRSTKNDTLPKNNTSPRLTINQHLANISTYLQIIDSSFSKILQKSWNASYTSTTLHIWPWPINHVKLEIETNGELDGMSNDKLQVKERTNFKDKSNVKFEVNDFIFEKENQN